MMDYLQKLFDLGNPFFIIYQLVEAIAKWGNSPAVNYAFNIYLLIVPLAMALALGYTVLELISRLNQ